jgi:hypothetical protein
VKKSAGTEEGIVCDVFQRSLKSCAGLLPVCTHSSTLFTIRCCVDRACNYLICSNSGMSFGAFAAGSDFKYA